MAKFRKKPVVIEAERWFKNGDHPEDGSTLITPPEKYRGEPGYSMEPFLSEGKIVRRYRHPDVSGGSLCISSIPCGNTMHDHGWIDTPEGGHNVCPGDWIITGIQGERYPCKPDIFEATYEAV